MTNLVDLLAKTRSWSIEKIHLRDHEVTAFPPIVCDAGAIGTLYLYINGEYLTDEYILLGHFYTFQECVLGRVCQGYGLERQLGGEPDGKNGKQEIQESERRPVWWVGEELVLGCEDSSQYDEFAERCSKVSVEENERRQINVEQLLT